MKKVLSIIVLVLIAVFVDKEEKPTEVMAFEPISLQTPVIPLSAEKPDLPSFVEEPKKEKVLLDTRDQKSYNISETLEIIKKYRADGGREALTEPKSMMFSHIQWHDMKDGFRNYSDAVIRGLTYQTQEYLHGMLHAEEDGFSLKVEVLEDKSAEEEENTSNAVILSRNRVIYVGASWCGPCVTFKSYKPFEYLKGIGWRVGSDEENHLQNIDVDKNKQEYNSLFPNGVGGIPYIAIMKDGKIVSSRHPSDFISNGKFSGEKFRGWITEKGNIFGWRN